MLMTDNESRAQIYLPHSHNPLSHPEKPHTHGSSLFSLFNYGPKMLRAGVWWVVGWWVVGGGSVGGWAL